MFRSSTRPIPTMIFVSQSEICSRFVLTFIRYVGAADEEDASALARFSRGTAGGVLAGGWDVAGGCRVGVAEPEGPSPWRTRGTPNRKPTSPPAAIDASAQSSA